MKHTLRIRFRLPATAIPYALFCFCALLCTYCTTSADFRLPETGEPTVDPEPSLQLYPRSVSADAAGGTYRITVAASGVWLAESADACTLRPQGGDADTHAMDVTLVPNETPDERVVTVIVRAGGPRSDVWAQVVFSQPAGRKAGIASLDDLRSLARAVNAGESLAAWEDAEGVIRQQADIDFGGVASWTPIGLYGQDGEVPFIGVYDGGGFRLLNCRLTQDGASSFGIFGYNTGTIRNLTVEGFSVCGSGTTGALCGRNAGLIEQCTNRTQVGSESTAANVGGICGTNLSGGVVRNCRNEGGVSGHAWIGGICGQNGVRTETIESIVAECVNTGPVTSDGSMAGGIAGATFSTVRGCKNAGEVRSANSAAGIAALAGSPGTQGGAAIPCVVERCINTGAVSGSGNWTGGIVGSASAGHLLSNSNSGTVTGVPTPTSTSQWTGGIAGSVTNGSRIKACSNSGTVYSPGNYCGGIVAYCNASLVESCTNASQGLVRGSGSFIGGVVADLYQGTIVSSANYGKAELAAESALDVEHFIGGICGYNYFGTITGSDYRQGLPAVICPASEGPGAVN